MLRLFTIFISMIMFMSFSACAPKVDCKKLKGKLDECTEEILWALREESKENYEKHEDKEKVKKQLDDAVKELKSALDEKVYKPCKKYDGRAKDAKKVNKCLEQKSCEDFAACLVQFLKK